MRIFALIMLTYNILALAIEAGIYKKVKTERFFNIIFAMLVFTFTLH